MIFLYNLLLVVALVLSLPYFLAKSLLTGKYRRSLGAKIGCADFSRFTGIGGKPRILVHAVSVGEVTVAVPVIARLREMLPAAAIFLSVTTETGKEMADKITAGANSIFFAPLDLPFAVRRMLRGVAPDAVVLVEAELWPNLINACNQRGIKVILINGRISARSFERYRRTRFFWRRLLAGVDKAGVISPADASRLAHLGIAEEKIFALGNAKNDGLASQVSLRLREETARRFFLEARDRVFVAGSTHEGEERILFRTFRHLLGILPDLRLIIVPRHPQRASAVRQDALHAGFADAVLFSEMGAVGARSRVVVVDVIGELFKIYSVAEVVFCGGSLVPRGGQNILEAAAWGNVVFYGRYMDDFLMEKSALEEVGAGVCVADGEELGERILALLKDPAKLKEGKEKAREVVVAGMGAATSYSKLISSCLSSGHEQRQKQRLRL